MTESDTVPQPATRVRPPVRTRPVRVTVDLAPRAYAVLARIGQELAEQSGRARVPHVAVLRALLDEMSEDAALRDRIAQRLAP